MINTRFWIDDYISHLDPTEKLMFLYFLTNPLTDICGVYEIPLKNIALDTGIDKEMVEKIIKRFCFYVIYINEGRHYMRVFELKLLTTFIRKYD